MKRYIKASSDDLQLLNTTFRELFEEMFDDCMEIFGDEADPYTAADFIAQHMVEFRDYEDWYDLARKFVAKKLK